MKKNKGLIASLICILSIVVCGFLAWDVVLYEIIPWTKTEFVSHQSYLKLLAKNHGFGEVFFVKDIPKDSGDVRYYWHRDFIENFAAYSVILSEKDYEKIAENRLEAYYGEWQEYEDDVIYVLQGEDYCYIEDSGWYNQEKLRYIDEVLSSSEEQGYYFLIVVKFYTTTGTSYNGVMLNDSTQELVEFSFELADEDWVS